MKAPAELTEMYEKFRDVLKKDYPLTWSTGSKRILPPNGYTTNEHFKLMTFAPFTNIMSGHIPDGDTQNGMALYALALSFMRYRFPTFYITESFADAIWNTDPPPGMTLEGIHWPLEAMLFMLPEAWCAKTLGERLMPELGVAHAPVGAMPIGDLDYIEKEYSYRLIQPQSTHDRFIYAWSDYYTTTEGHWSEMNHDGVYRQSFSVAEIEGHNPTSLGYFFVGEKNDGYPQEQELTYAKAVRRFIIRLLLSLNAAPQHIEYSETCQRKAKVKHGRERDALWSPNWIGRSYRVVREGPVEKHEPGWHVRIHWRKGHFRTQRYGRLLGQTKVIWIEPVLVNAKMKDE